MNAYMCVREREKERVGVCIDTHVRIFFDGHKEFLLQVDDGAHGVRQLQRVFISHPVYCVVIHVLTYSVDLCKTHTTGMVRKVEFIEHTHTQ